MSIELILGIYRMTAILLLVAAITLVFTGLQSTATSMGLDILQLGLQLVRDTLASLSSESP